MAAGPGETLVVVKKADAPATGRVGAASDALGLGFNDHVEVPDTLETSDPVAPATLRLRPQNVLRMPGAIDNVFRALQVLPGVTGAGLVETRIAVRGGAPDQNLTVMDGVEIHNPFRLFGAVAGFNPETVSRFELTAGVFAAQYGDRLSSMLVVETRDGRHDQGFAGSAAASVTDAAGVLEGRLPGPGGGSWLLAGRRTYYELAAEPILGDGRPRFDDLQLKLAWGDAGHRRLGLTAWRSREGSDADWSGGGDTALLGSSGANDLLALNFTTPLGRRAFSRSVVSTYAFDESLDFTLRSRSATRTSFDRRPARSSVVHQYLSLVAAGDERAFTELGARRARGVRERAAARLIRCRASRRLGLSGAGDARRPAAALRRRPGVEIHLGTHGRRDRRAAGSGYESGGVSPEPSAPGLSRRVRRARCRALRRKHERGRA